jgi:hypothetical protein
MTLPKQELKTTFIITVHHMKLVCGSDGVTGDHILQQMEQYNFFQ